LAAAQFNLALRYSLGQGVPHNDAQAAELFRESAMQGFAKAENNLGVLYEHGLGVKQDYAAAAKWYRKAATQGHAAAAYHLGRLYMLGSGVAQSYAEAWLWFDHSAQRSAGAQHDRAEKARDDAKEGLTPVELENLRGRANGLLTASPPRR
jgi:TPR repeat protein